MATANPSGATVTGGSANVTSGPGQVTVNQSSQRAVINWQQFSINRGETTTFVQPGSSSATLNRVTGNQMSQINGSLNANGKVYLINPQGVVVGKTGRVNTGGGFTASTLDVADQEFLAGKGMTFKGSSRAPVINQGKIKAVNGDVTLIARQVENQGKISAKKGQVTLAGGSEVLVMPSNTAGQRVFIRSGPGSVANSGSIRATAAELRAAGGNEYALAVNNSGVIRATGVDKSGGRIVLKAESGLSSTGRYTGNVQNSGSLIAKARAPGRNGGSITVTGDTVRLTSTSRIDASSQRPASGPPAPGAGNGGTVNIGGGFQGKDATIENAKVVVVEKGSTINVDGEAKGGSAVVWSDDATGYYGDISAKGWVAETPLPGISPYGGDVEVSSKGYLDFRGTVNTGGGSLLLDPSNMVISFAASSNIYIDLLTNPVDITSTLDYSTLDVTVLTNLSTGLLYSNNVFIHTSGAYSATYGLLGPASGYYIVPNDTPGDIVVDGAINYSSPYSLTLAAHNDIIVRSLVGNGYSGSSIVSDASINLIAGWSGTGTDFATITASSSNYGQGQGSIYLISGTTGSQSMVGSVKGDTRLAGYDLKLMGSNGRVQVGINGAGSDITGNIEILLKSALSMDGSSYFAQIGHGSNSYGYQDLGGNINITGVDNPLAVTIYAYSGGSRIGHGGNTTTADVVSGNINLNNIGSLNVYGNSAIGHGGNTFKPTSISGNIHVTGTGSTPVNLTVDSGTDNFVQIGHGGNYSGLTGSTKTNISGDITLENLGSITLNAFSGSSTRSAVQIGHGGYSSKMGTVGGDINLLSIGTLSLQTLGTATDGYRQIGHGGHYSTSSAITGSITAQLNSNADVVMTGSSGSGYTQIGHGGYEATLWTIGTGTASNITITAPDAGTSDLLLTNGGMYAQLGHGGSRSAVTSYASDITGNITLTSFDNVTLTGGSAANTLSPAQIGHGGSNLKGGYVTGSIMLTNAGAQTAYTLTGGTGNPVQIGHGGFTSIFRSFTGDITLGDAASVTLTAGSSNRSSVLIGHGGQASSTSAITSDISITSITSTPATLQVLGGATISTDTSFAQIGHGGATASVTTTNGTGNVSSDILINGFKDVLIKGGTTSPGSYAQIGNGGAGSSFTTSGTTTSDIIVNNALVSGNRVRLIADGGYAQLGDGGKNAVANNHNGSIAVSTTSLEITGGSVADAYAMIGIGTPTTSSTGYYGTINTSIALTNLSVLDLNAGINTGTFVQIGHGGLGSSNNTTIGSASTISVSGSDIVVTLDGRYAGSTATGSGGYAQIGHGGYNSRSNGLNGNITLSNISTLNVYGGYGSGDYNYAQIGHGGANFSYSGSSTVAIVGNITIEDKLGVSVKGGGTSYSYGQIGHGGYRTTAYSISGDISFPVVPDMDALFSITGGTSFFSYAQIGHGGAQLSSLATSITGNISFSPTGLLLRGGSGNYSYSQIGHGGWYASVTSVDGDITINNIGEDPQTLSVEGGYGSFGSPAYAQIGHGGANSTVHNIVGADGSDITINNFGDVIIKGGTSNIEGYAQIGHGGYSFTQNQTTGSINSDINISNYIVSGNRVRVLAAGGYALLGHGGRDADLGTLSGNISVSTHKVELFGGSKSGAFAMLGIATPSTTFSGSYVSINTSIAISNLKVLDLNAGTDLSTFAHLGHGGGGSVGKTGITTTASSIVITAPDGLGTDVTLDGRAAGSTTSGSGGYAQIGHGGYAGKANMLVGSITFNRIDLLTMVGGSGSGDYNYVQIGNGGALFASNGGSSPSISGTITLPATETVTLSGGSSAYSYVQIGHGGYREQLFSLSGDININQGTGPLATFTATGGTGAYSYVHLGNGGGQSANTVATSESGGISLTSTSVILQGGTGANTIVQIGHGGQRAYVGSLGGSITISGWNTLQLLAGNSVDSSVHIGHGGGSLFTGNNVVTGSIYLTAVQTATSSLLMRSSDYNYSYTQIGHGGGYTSRSYGINGSIIISNINVLELSAGDATASYSQIGFGGTSFTALGGISGVIDISMYSNNSSTTLSAGGGTGGSYAQIGHGGKNSLMNNYDIISSNIRIDDVYGTITLNGGASSGAYTQIGHGGLGFNLTTSTTASQTDLVGSITIEGKSATPGVVLQLNGGQGLYSYSRIGHGGHGIDAVSGADSISRFATLGGDIIMTNMWQLDMQGGTGQFGYTQIGHGGYFIAAASTISGNISYTANMNPSNSGVTLEGGTGWDTWAHIGHGGFYSVATTSIGGTISMAYIPSLKLLSGADFSFAQIGHGSRGFTTANTSGAISIPTIVNVLLGKTAAPITGDQLAYTQIGHGGAYSKMGVVSTADILLGTSSIFASVSLSAGDYDGGAYSQIGHGGISATATSINSVISLGNAQQVSLTAGNGTTTYAQIGHGGYSMSAPSVNGAISMNSAAILTITGGTTAGSYAYAQIGHGGANFKATSGVSGNINFNQLRNVTLTGGTGPYSYAQIGHGGGGSFSSVFSIIGTLTVGGSSLGNNVTLQGGSGTNSYAQIGYGGVDGGSTSTTQGSISLTSLDSLRLLAGSASSAYAQIGHGGPLTNASSYTGGITLTGRADVIGQSVLLQGGNANYAYALIGHGGVNNTLSTVTITADIALSNLGAVSLSGGTASSTSAFAQIGHGGADFDAGSVSGTIQLTGTTVAGSSPATLSLTGGSGTDGSYAQIGHGGIYGIITGAGPFTNSISLLNFGEVNLTGGSGANSYAQVGHGGYSAFQYNSQGNIRVDFITGTTASLSLTGGTGTGAIAQIGHGGIINNTSGTITNTSGSIWVTDAQTLNLTGGAAADTYAMIGHGGSSWTSNNISGQISLNVSGETSLIAGTGPSWSDPLIGHRGTGTFSSANFLLRTGTLDESAATATDSTVGTILASNITEANAKGDFTLVSATNLTLGAPISDPASSYILSLLSQGNVTISSLGVSALTNTGTGALYLVAGYDGASGTTGIYGNPTGTLVDQTAFFNPSTTAGDITISSDISYVGDINLIAGGSITVDNPVLLTTTGNFLAIVDNLNPVSPNYSATALFTNNGTITATQATIYAVDATSTTLGNLSALPSVTGIWYGMPGAITPGVNYKLP